MTRYNYWIFLQLCQASCIYWGYIWCHSLWHIYDYIPSSGSLECKMIERRVFHWPPAWRGRGRWWWPRCCQRGPAWNVWRWKLEMVNHARSFLKLTISRTTSCRSVTWCFDERTYFRRLKSVKVQQIKSSQINKISMGNFMRIDKIYKYKLLILWKPDPR